MTQWLFHSIFHMFICAVSFNALSSCLHVTSRAQRYTWRKPIFGIVFTVAIDITFLLSIIGLNLFLFTFSVTVFCKDSCISLLFADCYFVASDEVCFCEFITFCGEFVFLFKPFTVTVTLSDVSTSINLGNLS